MAVLARGPGQQVLTKVKGHATAAQVEEGRVKPEDKEGNDWADSFAERGAKQQTNTRYGDTDFESKRILAG